MKRFFNPDNPVMVFLGKLADMMLLSLLWFVCCLPVLTIGPATTALYFAVMRINHPDGRIFKDFFRSFRQNFWQGLVAELVSAILLTLTILEFRVLLRTGFGKSGWSWFLLAVLGIGSVGWSSWVFPILAKFECTWKQLLRTPIMFSILHFFTGIIIVCVNLLPLVALLASDKMLPILPVFLFLGPSGIAWVNSIALKKVFSKYITEPSE